MSCKTDLPDRGFQLTFAKPNDDEALLAAFGVALHDHLIYFAPENKGEYLPRHF